MTGSTNTLEKRLSAAEKARTGPQGVHVIAMYEPGEEKVARQQAELIASGAAKPDDLFVILRKFSQEPLDGRDTPSAA